MNTNSTRTSWAVVLILSGAGVLSALQVGKVPPLIPDIRSELGITLVHAGWVLSIFNIIGLLLGACAGAIADTLGHRNLLVTGLVLQALGSMTGAFTPSFEWLLLTRFIEGMGFLSVIVSTPTLIFQAVNTKDTKVALSIWTCYLPAGACLMMLMIPILLKVFTWRGIWQVNALLILLYIPLIIWVTRKLSRFTTPLALNISSVLRNVMTTLCAPGPLLLMLLFFTYALQWLAVMGFLPTLLLEHHQFSKHSASALTGIVVGCNIIGNLAGGWLLNRGFRRWVLMAAASGVMGASALCIYSPDSGLLVNYGGCLLFSTIGGLIPASALGAAPIFAPNQNLVSTTVGMIIQGGQSGQVFGPTLLAWIVSTTGTWASGGGFLAAVAGFGIAFSVLISRLTP
mgnify:CR=1 FL=1